MRKSLLLALAICISLTFTALAQKTTDVPVTCIIRDSVDVIDPATGVTQAIPMQVQSDGAGPYKNSKSVISVIQGIGDWLLDTGITIRTPTRQVLLDFSQAITGSAPNGGNPSAPFVAGLVSPRFRSKLAQYGYNMLTMSYGQTINAPVTIGFYYPADSGTHYRIHMTPGEQSSFPSPLTDFAEMTCTGVDANLKCNRCQIKPTGVKGGCVTADCSVKRNRVKLVKVITRGNSVTETDLGDYLRSFSIDITRP